MTFHNQMYKAMMQQSTIYSTVKQVTVLLVYPTLPVDWGQRWVTVAWSVALQ